MKQDAFNRTKDRDLKPGHKSASSRSKINVKPRCDLRNKPFIGRIFYLDLPWNLKTQLLENDIKALGGTVEKFFSKEIKYLVSSKPEARYVHRLLPDSPVPSPDSGVSSPRPCSRRECQGHRSSSQGGMDMVSVSRGKSLVDKVVKEQERVQMNGILASAMEWGIKVLYVEDVVSYIDKKKLKVMTATNTPASMQHVDKSRSQTNSAGQIRRPFVKVEDSSSPFLVEEHGKVDPKKNLKVHRTGEERGTKGKRERARGHEKRKGGYCECCEVKFENLKVHLLSGQHQAFSKSDEYEVVDRVTAELTCNFRKISKPCRSVKCSSSTPIVNAGAMFPVMEELVSANGVGKQESEVSLLFDSTAKAEWTVEIPRKRSRGQSEFPCRNSLKDQSDVPEKSQSKRGSFEWELFSPSYVCKTEGGSFLSREQNSCALESRTNPDYESVTEVESLKTNLSENHTQSLAESQVDKSTLFHNAEHEMSIDGSHSIQRKIQSGRPRRKKQVPASGIESTNRIESLRSHLHVEFEKPPASLLDLWHLFQSSDDVDEFKGFSE
ncbi:hypothetical protein DNTS_014104 [Danionella cerebrum]|uniref:Protein DBF4 homolog A n=1 Tax=Danionella cerebrum TaxID=2873325 RepID=A0A553QWK1_9TELE|nr:hypothetical protein DNTS_014104 [Danionella translucida]